MNSVMKITSRSLVETESFARQFLELLDPSSSRGKKRNGACVVGLYGDLGSGKTAFAQAVAKFLGIKETVTSPTYVIEKIYSINSLPTAFKHLIHIDAYRLEKSSELVHLGWHEITANPTNLILIEWPERVADIMPAGHIRLQFTFIDETTREIEMLGFSSGNK
jgi:tRNA threonylcarbamoyladenosine biosynthesis protein TsaE